MASLPLLLAIVLCAAVPARAEDSMKTFKYGKPFELAFGESARGPQDLELHYDGLGFDTSGKIPEPGLRFVSREGSGYPIWARPFNRGPGDLGGRGLWSDWVVTLIAAEAEDPNTATLEVRRAKVRDFPVGEPFVLEPYSFARGPDGWAVGLVQATEAAATHLDVVLIWQRPDMESEFLNLTCDPTDAARAQQGWYDYLVAAREVLPREGGPAAVRLELWKPAETVREVALGSPFTLFPGETAVAPGGLRVKNQGFGHKILLDGSDEGFFAFDWSLGDLHSSEWLHWPGRGLAATAEIEGYSLTVVEAEWGPPHRGDRPTVLRLDRP